MIPEDSLLKAGFLRERCREPLEDACANCGTHLHPESITPNGVNCPACGPITARQVRTSCRKCGSETLEPGAAAEHACGSVKQFREAGKIAFRPPGALWQVIVPGGAAEAAGESQLADRIRQGRVSREALAQREDASAWHKISDIPAFKAMFSAPPPPPPPPVPRPPVPPPEASRPEGAKAEALAGVNEWMGRLEGRAAEGWLKVREDFWPWRKPGRVAESEMVENLTRAMGRAEGMSMGDPHLESLLADYRARRAAALRTIKTSKILFWLGAGMAGMVTLFFIFPLLLAMLVLIINGGKAP